MSQQKSGAASAETFPEEAVADYLRSHPDFFERHSTLLLALKLPHRTGGSAISLVERQVAMLRQRNAQLERQFKDLVAVAKLNDALVEKIHQLGMKLMRVNDVSAAPRAARNGLARGLCGRARGPRVCSKARLRHAPSVRASSSE